MLYFVHKYGTDSYKKLRGRGGDVGENWEGHGENPTLVNLVSLQVVHIVFIINFVSSFSCLSPQPILPRGEFSTAFL